MYNAIKTFLNLEIHAQMWHLMAVMFFTFMIGIKLGAK